jgi:hypothetical protein
MYKELCFIQRNNVNQNCLHVDGDFKMGDRSTLATHLSQEIKDFVMEQLRLGLIVFQNMAKLRQHVKNMLRICSSLNKMLRCCLGN